MDKTTEYPAFVVHKYCSLDNTNNNCNLVQIGIDDGINFCLKLCSVIFKPSYKYC